MTTEHRVTVNLAGWRFPEKQIPHLWKVQRKYVTERPSGCRPYCSHISTKYQAATCFVVVVAQVHMEVHPPESTSTSDPRGARHISEASMSSNDVFCGRCRPSTPLRILQRFTTRLHCEHIAHTNSTARFTPRPFGFRTDNPYLVRLAKH